MTPEPTGAEWREAVDAGRKLVRDFMASKLLNREGREANLALLDMLEWVEREARRIAEEREKR